VIFHIKYAKPALTRVLMTVQAPGQVPTLPSPSSGPGVVYLWSAECDEYDSAVAAQLAGFPQKRKFLGSPVQQQYC